MGRNGDGANQRFPSPIRRFAVSPIRLFTGLERQLFAQLRPWIGVYRQANSIDR
jgi:hypothetical protein